MLARDIKNVVVKQSVLIVCPPSCRMAMTFRFEEAVQILSCAGLRAPEGVSP